MDIITSLVTFSEAVVVVMLPVLEESSSKENVVGKPRHFINTGKVQEEKETAQKHFLKIYSPTIGCRCIDGM